MIQLGDKYCTTFSKEFEVPMKLVRLIQMPLTETYSKFHICKYLSENLLNHNGLRQGHRTATDFQPCFGICY
jgi:hypothetical protein